MSSLAPSFYQRTSDCVSRSSPRQFQRRPAFVVRYDSLTIELAEVYRDGQRIDIQVTPCAFSCTFVPS